MQLDCQLVLDAFADAVVAADGDGRIFYVNAAAETLLGWSRAELSGEPLTVLIPARLHQSHSLGFNRYLSTRRAELIGRPVRVPALRKDRSEVEVELTLSALDGDGGTVFIGALRDMRERVELERQLTVTRHLRAVTTAAAALTSHLDLEQVVQTVVRTLAADFDAALARLWLYEPGTHTLHLRASAGLSTATATSKRAMIDVGTHPSKVGEVARTRKLFVRNGLRGDPKFEQDWVEREELHSVACLPLISGGALRGVVVYFSRQELHPEVVHVLESFAAMAAASINDVQLFQREQAARAEATRQREEAECQAEELRLANEELQQEAAERRRAETALRESEERLRSIVENSTAIVYLKDLDGRYLLMNHHWHTLLGKPEAVGKTDHELFPAALADALRENDLRVVETRTALSFEERIEEGGQTRFFVSQKFPLLKADGTPYAVGGVSTEITELKRAEEELRHQKELLRTITDNADSALVMMDVGGHLTYVNPAFTRITGYSAEDIRGIPLHNAVHYKYPDGKPFPIEECPIGRSYTHLQPIRGHQDVFVRKDGTLFPTVSAVAPLEKEGQTVGGVLEFRDVTEEKARERTLNFLVELHEATRPLLEPADIMATAARLVGEHLAVSRCAYAPMEEDEDHFNILGDYTRDCKSIVGRYPLSAFGARAVREMRASRPYVVNDIDREAPPGEDVAAYRLTQIQAVICVSLVKAGRLVALMAVHQTTPRQWTAEEVRLVEMVAERCWAYIERAEADKQLRESATRLGVAFAASRMGDWIWDPATGLVSCSDRAAEILGVPQDHAFRWSDLRGRLSEEDQERAHAAREQAIAERTDYDIEYRMVLPEGVVRWVSARGRAVYTPDGEVRAVLGVVQDITERKLAEEALRDADRRKDEFLAMLGHELRNPLGAISNAMYVLRRRSEDPHAVRQYLAMLDRQVALMARLVGDMQDLSRIKTGKLVLRPEVIPIARVMREAVETVVGLMEEKRHELALALPDEGLRIEGDPARLTQVLSNILNNAAKYTLDGGRISFSGWEEGDAVVLRVADTGMGIAPDALTSIFELFSQSERTLGESRQGLGIGLSLVRGLVEMHGGTVAASSGGLGRGSEFTVRLPAVKGQEKRR